MPGLGFASAQIFEPFYRSEDDAVQSWEDPPAEELQRDMEDSEYEDDTSGQLGKATDSRK